MGDGAAAADDVLEVFTSPCFRRDPFPFLSRLRQDDPVHRTSAGFYLLTRHADALRAMRGSGDAVVVPDRAALDGYFPSARGHPALECVLDSLVCKNPPEHTRLRRAVTQRLTPRRVRAMQDPISRTCDRLLDRVDAELRDGGVVDLYRDFALPLASWTLGDLLGVAERDRAWLGAAVADVADGASSGSAPLLAHADQSARSCLDYLDGLIGQRRRAPGDDLCSALAGLERSGALSGDEPRLLLWMLLLASVEITAGGIGHGVRAIFAYPDRCAWLGNGGERALAFADEVMRHAGVSIFTVLPQVTTRDMRFGGVVLPAGSDVRPVPMAANRDPAAFADPDRFDPGRDTTHSLAFYQGIHFCPGAVLARTQMAVALSRLCRRFPAIAPGGEPVWNRGLSTRIMRTLPVRLGTRGP
jgi:cytochrome P450